jgi:DNA modification methylase
VVSREMGRHFIGFEIVPEYFEFAEQRLKETLPRE